MLEPAIAQALERKFITESENHILLYATRNETVKASHLSEIAPMLKSNQRTYQIRCLGEQGMLQPIHEGARIYTVMFCK
ncbi:MAG: hypothetical protein V4525_15100 [Pseudomonadota bacterium]